VIVWKPAGAEEANKHEEWNISRLPWVIGCRRMTRRTRKCHDQHGGRGLSFEGWS